MLKLNPSINFDGNTEEASPFYKSVSGGAFYGLVKRMDSLAGTEYLWEDKKSTFIAFWGAFLGRFRDRFGAQWIVGYKKMKPEKAPGCQIKKIISYL